MEFGLGTLQLSPDQFWGLSVPELMAAMRCHGYFKRETVSRSWLEDIQTRFPDAHGKPDNWISNAKI